MEKNYAYIENNKIKIGTGYDVKSIIDEYDYHILLLCVSHLLNKNDEKYKIKKIVLTKNKKNIIVHTITETGWECNFRIEKIFNYKEFFNETEIAKDIINEIKNKIKSK